MPLQGDRFLVETSIPIALRGSWPGEGGARLSGDDEDQLGVLHRGGRAAKFIGRLMRVLPNRLQATNFPKFGFGLGRQSLVEVAKGFIGAVEFTKHDYDGLKFIPSVDYLVVEGTSRGAISGKSWEGGTTPGGRFCNVFRLRGDRIASVHVYLDPDYTGENESRFRWGKDRRW
jgi:hypothetical protein